LTKSAAAAPAASVSTSTTTRNYQVVNSDFYAACKKEIFGCKHD